MLLYGVSSAWSSAHHALISQSNLHHISMPHLEVDAITRKALIASVQNSFDLYFQLEYQVNLTKAFKRSRNGTRLSSKYLAQVQDVVSPYYHIISSSTRTHGTCTAKPNTASKITANKSPSTATSRKILLKYYGICNTRTTPQASASICRVVIGDENKEDVHRRTAIRDWRGSIEVERPVAVGVEVRIELMRGSRLQSCARHGHARLRGG
jgi:hypothetical protein